MSQTEEKGTLWSLPRRWYLWAVIILWVLAAVWEVSAADQERGIFIWGLVLDSHLKPVRDAVLRVRLDGEPQRLVRGGKGFQELRSSSDGSYALEIHPSGSFTPKSVVEMEVSKPGFMAMRIPLELEEFARKGEHFYMRKDISLPRSGGPALWIAAGIFVGVYLLMAFELVHRTVATMLGCSSLLLVSYTLGSVNPNYRIISFPAAVAHIDINVVLLLLGAMIIVGVIRRTGGFLWLVKRCFLLGDRRGFTMALLLMFLSAGVSALVDNVTTIVLLAPPTIALAQGLRLNPLCLLVPQVLAANVGGTATLIGEPSNLMIGSHVGLSFWEFLENLGPVCGLAVILLFAMSWLWYRGDYTQRKDHGSDSREEGIQDGEKLTDKRLLGVALVVSVGVLGLLFSQGHWKMEASVAVLSGAAVLFAYGVLSRRVRMMDFLEKDIEWPSLMFLVFLFIMTGALEEVGALSAVADLLLGLCKASPEAAICVVIWGSALLAAFVDNLPFTAAMLRVVAQLSGSIPEAHVQSFWWALALGVSLGGNGTLIGGSANMVAMGIANSAGYPISFIKFMKFGFLYMVLSVGICNAWLLVFYR